MSRYTDCDHESFPNAGALWQANAERALRGKRGRKVLTLLREALLNLPEKRLIEGALCTVGGETRQAGEAASCGFDGELRESIEDNRGEGVCAVGAMLWWRKVKAGTDPDLAFAELPTLLGTEFDLHETAVLANQQAGVVLGLAAMLAYKNDETLAWCTPEERYTRYLAWLDTEMGEQVPA